MVLYRKERKKKNGTQKKKSSATSAPESSDLRAEIEKRACEIWLNEGGGHGMDLDHWLRAESELAALQLGRQREASATLLLLPVIARRLCF